MDSYRSDTTLKLAYNELSLGNYASAETYFKRAIESENHPSAWLGLGSARLSYLFDNKELDVDSVNRLLKSAFQCFQEAKAISPDNAETIENKLLSTSFNQLKVYYEEIKKYYDLYKSSNSKATNTAYMGIAAVLFKSHELSRTMSYMYVSHTQQKNAAAEQINLFIQTAVAVRNNTISSIEYALPARDAFIREISQLEYELQWYLTDEKEKKKILEQQKAAAQKEMQNNNSQASNAVKKDNSKQTNYLKIVLWIILILVIIRLFQLLFW
ncbi:hypothetical protein SAMN05444008_1305 [Cnuella takakiae]|uniref:Tetratricopeptide repeat-containing protein n=1 Tax=Cnuella takakiae TaxID=1302690 RepID=A0A1M5JAR0_9BACT|nr:hypothetical protein [Cnuella takakiae]OLY95603.1 hypothetical protein BUE76_00445 [Cnuella takakiae]SHG37637.1 hypothetical protein SAMN05444008_1305 [Cnuella takakiae]